jgi:hypothetical protein
MGVPLEATLATKLEQKGGIFDLAALMAVSKKHLSAYVDHPKDERRYIRRLHWGLTWVLTQWLKQNPDFKASNEALNVAAQAELTRLYAENALPKKVMDFIAAKMRVEIEQFYAQWVRGELTPEQILPIDTLVCDALWLRMKENKTDEPLNKVLLPQVKMRIDILMLKKFKDNDLPRDFSAAWQTRILERVGTRFDESSLSDGLCQAITERVEKIVKDQYKGRYPKNMVPIYDEALQDLVSSWMANHLAPSVVAEINDIATEMRIEMKLPSDCLMRIEREAVKCILEDVKQKGVATVGAEDILYQTIFMVVEHKILSPCATIEGNSLYKLYQIVMVSAIAQTFTEWMECPDLFEEDIHLMDLLPEHKDICGALEDKTNLSSLYHELEHKNKEIEALRARLALLEAAPVNTDKAASKDDEPAEVAVQHTRVTFFSANSGEVASRNNSSGVDLKIKK